MGKFLKYIGLLFCGFLFLIILAISVTQTSFFKNWLKKNIERQANSVLNGQLHIGHIEGNLVRFFEISDMLLTNKGDTIIDIPSLYVRLLPQRIIYHNLYIQIVRIENLGIHLKQNKDQSWNFSDLVKTSQSNAKESSSSEMNWDIQFENVKLNLIK